MFYQVASLKTSYRGKSRRIGICDFPKPKHTFLNDRVFDELLEKYLICQVFEDVLPNDYQVNDEIINFATALRHNNIDCEIMLYDFHPLKESERIKFLGIDIVDIDEDSLIERSLYHFQKLAGSHLNSNQLFEKLNDAELYKYQLNKMSPEWHPVYVYMYDFE